MLPALVEASPTGLEPALPAPEAGALSSELRGLCPNYSTIVNSACNLVITPKSPRLRESGLLDEWALQILRCAQDGSRGCVILSAAKDLWRTYG